jgi:D-alanyl-lipoteichoic acid acyltransferase DltB (MBOAT superfamily)
MSLVFYGWWNFAYLGLILSSMLFNYAVGVALGLQQQVSRKLILIAGIAFNLALLGYFKYANFAIDSLNYIAGTNFTLENIILPLAISFFTFQQIAYLVDAYQGETREYNFLHYCLFVTFFPQLIAGPIVHHKEMLPQFASQSIYRIHYENIIVGLTIFTIGLFKKVVLADNVASFSTPVFESADAGETIGFLQAWAGALGYTCQLYFDFSGYADMAIGSARLFGIRLPINFHSPYKSLNISEFWRRWHITLSRFLRDYLYIPLGGSRRGKSRRYLNLMITMLLGGLWHGAGWTFVIWGCLHGGYLVVNHAWHWLKERTGLAGKQPRAWSRLLAWTVTFLAVVVGWVFFRAETFAGAYAILSGMMGQNGIVLPDSFPNAWPAAAAVLSAAGVTFSQQDTVSGISGAMWISSLLFIAVFFPNSAVIMRRFSPVVEPMEETRRNFFYRLLIWNPTSSWAFVMGVLFMISLIFMLSPSEFLYWQF